MANSGQTESTPSAKQLVFLSMMATVVAVIVFLCGVLVGRGVPARRVTGGVEAGLGATGLEDTLRGRGAAADGSPLDDLSYFRRLNTPAPSASSAEPAAPDETTATPTDDAASPAPPATERIPAPPTDGDDADDAGDIAHAAAPAAGAGYMVQVTALRDAGAARAIAEGLRTGGYRAVVVDPPDGAPVGVFRVRVGPFADRAAAERVSARLQTEEAYTTWVIQP